MSARKKKPLSSFPAEAESRRGAVLSAILGYGARPVNARISSAVNDCRRCLEYLQEQ